MVQHIDGTRYRMTYIEHEEAYVDFKNEQDEIVTIPWSQIHYMVEL